MSRRTAWGSAIQRFRKKCSDLDGNTRSKSKVGLSGEGSFIVGNDAQFASPRHKIEKVKTRKCLISSTAKQGTNGNQTCSPICASRHLHSNR